MNDAVLLNLFFLSPRLEFFSNAANSPADLIGISNNDTMLITRLQCELHNSFLVISYSIPVILIIRMTNLTALLL